MTSISLAVNGRAITTSVEPRQHLGDFLREELLLTATHLGCEHGVCGACTVLIDGAPARSCIAYPAALDGAAVTTLEGLADDPVMVRLRAAFTAEHALQCGFCTPGMLIMARDIVLRRPGLEEEAIRHELAGNLCRCTGYRGIVQAIKRVADAQRGESPAVTRGQTVAAASSSPLTLPAMPAPAIATTVPAFAPAPAAAAGRDDGVTASEPLRNPLTLEQGFDVPAPRAAVWAVLTDPARVVACLPGARLTEPSDGRQIRAEMTVKLGPLQAAFGGTGLLTLDPDRWSGDIAGSGVDARSATRVQARLHFRVEEAGAGASQVAVVVAYALQGPLAQMSRGALARDLAGRLTTIFAVNLSATLTGAPKAAAGPSLNAGALAFAMLKGWLGRLFRRPA